MKWRHEDCVMITTWSKVQTKRKEERRQKIHTKKDQKMNSTNQVMDIRHDRKDHLGLSEAAKQVTCGHLSVQLLIYSWIYDWIYSQIYASIR